MGLKFLGACLPEARVYCPKPGWGMYPRIAERALTLSNPYEYRLTETGVDMDRILEQVRTYSRGSIIILPAGAHYPSGLQPNETQWDGLLSLCQERSLYPFFDLAYQGLESGDLAIDAHVIRKFAQGNVPMMISQSFSANMGLYGDRLGAIHCLCADSQSIPTVMSQLKVQVRKYYSASPLHSARVATRVLRNPRYFALWEQEMKAIVARLAHLRSSLQERLIALKTPGNWKTLSYERGFYSPAPLTGSFSDCYLRRVRTKDIGRTS